MILELILDAEGAQGFTVYAMDGVFRLLSARIENEELAKVAALVARVSEHGVPKNTMKSRLLRSGIFELKCGRVRLAYFYDAKRRRVIVVTHFFLKDSQKTDPAEIRYAEQLRLAFEVAQEEGNVTYG